MSQHDFEIRAWGDLQQKTQDELDALRAALLALRDEMQTRGPYGLPYATVAERLTALLERP